MQDFYYDGTRWLSSTLFSTTAPASATLAASGEAARLYLGPPPFGSDMWLVSVQSAFNVAGGGTALGASHRWVVVLSGLPTGSLTATDTINSGASAVWRGDTVAVGALIGANYLLLYTATKTGSPGNLLWSATIYYRIVAT